MKRGARQCLAAILGVAGVVGVVVLPVGSWGRVVASMLLACAWVWLAVVEPL